MEVRREPPERFVGQVLFVGREGYASASVTAGFESTGVMVMHKVLPKAKNPQDVADAVLACKVTPTEGGGRAITG